VLLPGGADAPKRRVNPAELALWILGFVLLLVSVVLVVDFVNVVIMQSTEVTTPSSSTSHLDMEIAIEQATTVYTPGLVTGGIVCIALAILLRGLDINARRRNLALPSHETVPTPAPVSPASEVPVEQARTPPARVESRTTDYAPFMRPSGDSTDSPQ
jgi:hypothetical protein